jgi:hypothetical protein
MTKKIFLYSIFFILILTAAPAQEVITGLQSNYLISNNGDKEKSARTLFSADTLELPFFDDFSQASYYPDTRKWIDNFVFINNTYSDLQITSGVATFDALSNTGKLYDDASSVGFEADHFTSRPINLNYTVSNNIWLSFLYQAGGLSDPPEINDNLILQFFAPSEKKWYSVWKAEGTTDKKFKAVTVPVDQTRFLKKGFQFRFINYASLSANLTEPSMSGNCDIWNIDYVLLNTDRNAGDTIFADVALTLPMRSLLKKHEAMPWKQFKVVSLQEMGSSIPVHYRNNDEITRNITRNFEIWDVYKNSQAHLFSPGATNISPFTSVDYNANLIYTFNSVNPDSALFRITCSLKTDAFDPKNNDTLVYYQTFKNYFAFDDGSAEAGYGINGLGSRNAMVAYRFRSFMEDTLRAIQIFFNHSYLDANKRSFDLMVWDDNNGSPGNVIYSVEEVMVEQGTNPDGFYKYTFPEGVMVNDVFYVGWRQRSETFLNAGFDINTPHDGKQFYWLNGLWNVSQVLGSIMIRPVLGTPTRITSINDVITGNKHILKIWPNPAVDYISIDPGTEQFSGQTYISVTDLSGREIMNVKYTGRIDVSALHDGIYLITLSFNGKPLGYNRFIKTR